MSAVRAVAAAGTSIASRRDRIAPSPCSTFLPLSGTVAVADTSAFIDRITCYSSCLGYLTLLSYFSNSIIFKNETQTKKYKTLYFVHKNSKSCYIVFNIR